MFTNLYLYAGSPPATPPVLLCGPVNGTMLANSYTLQIPIPLPAGIAVTVGPPNYSLCFNAIGPKNLPTPATCQAIAGPVGGTRACTFIV